MHVLQHLIHPLTSMREGLSPGDGQLLDIIPPSSCAAITAQQGYETESFIFCGFQQQFPFKATALFRQAASVTLVKLVPSVNFLFYGLLF